MDRLLLVRRDKTISFKAPVELVERIDAICQQDPEISKASILIRLLIEGINLETEKQSLAPEENPRS